MLEARPAWPRRRSARGPPRRTRRGRSGRSPELRADGPRLPPRSCDSRRPGCARAGRPRRRPARPSARRRWPPRGGSRPRGRPRRGRASSWRWLTSRPGTRAPWTLANSPTIREAEGSQGRAAAPGRQLGAGRQVEERRQHRAVADLAGRHQLRDRERPDVGRRPAPAGRVDVRDGAVGRAQVDADEVAGSCHESGQGPSGVRDRSSCRESAPLHSIRPAGPAHRFRSWRRSRRSVECGGPPP